MKGRLLGAVQFLTVIPIRGETAALGQAAVFFPAVGAVLGASAGAMLHWGGGTPLAALVALTYLVAITGCLHEDGLADVADAVRAGRSREKILLILKDSRIGAYGAVAVVLVILLRWQALGLCQVEPVYGLAGALGLSRASLVLLGGLTPALGEGLGREFAAGISRRTLWAAAAQAVAFASLAGWRHGAAMVVGSALMVTLARVWFVRRLGGVNGDCLGATCQAVETVNLLILAWRPSF
jgi:adenosylcobinamide-GDP ribazoletransferase